MTDRSLETKVALIGRDVEEIRAALFGDEKTGRKGVVQQVEAMADALDKGRWAWRSVLWLGATLVALLTVAAQMRTAITTFWGH